MDFINAFHKGIKRDRNHVYQDKDSWYDARNIRILNNNSNQLSVENIKGNEYSFSLLEGYTALGAYEIGRVIVITSCNDSGLGDIGYYDILGGVYVTSMPNDSYRAVLNWRTTNRHEVYCEYNYDGSVTAYIAENTSEIQSNNINPNRFITLSASNLQISSEYNTVDAFDILTYPKLVNNEPRIELSVVNNSGGTLVSGGYRYSIRYLDDNGNATTWSMLSGLVEIFKEDLDGNWNEVIGNDVSIVTSKSVKLRLVNLDTRYDRVELGAMIYQGSTYDSIVINSYKITDTVLYVTHTGYEPSIQDIDSADFNVPDIAVTQWKTQTVIDNRLFIGNLKTYSYYRQNLEAIANRIQLKWRTKSLSNSVGNFSKLIYNSTTLTNESAETGHVGDYQNVYNVFSYVGYRRSEQYCFGIQFLFRNGTESEVFPIGKGDVSSLMNLNGVNTAPIRPLLKSSPDTSSPNAYNLNDAFVYESPNNVESPIISNGAGSEGKNMDNMYVQVLHPYFINIDITSYPNYDKEIQGFYIVRMERDIYGRIQASGLATHTMWNDIDSNVVAPYNNRVATAAGLVQAMNTADHCLMAFYSPDIYIGKRQIVNPQYIELCYDSIKNNGSTATTSPNGGVGFYKPINNAEQGYWQNVRVLPDQTNITYYEQQFYTPTAPITNKYLRILENTYAFGGDKLSSTFNNYCMFEMVNPTGGKVGLTQHDCWIFKYDGTPIPNTNIVEELMIRYGIPVPNGTQLYGSGDYSKFGYVINIVDPNRVYPQPIDRFYIYTNTYIGTTSASDTYNPGGIYSVDVYGGDTFISRNYIREYINDADQSNESAWNTQFLGFYCESHINSQLRHVFIDKDTNDYIPNAFFPYELGRVDVAQLPALINGDEREEYQDGYHAAPQPQSTQSYDPTYNYQGYFPTQIRYSEIKPVGSKVDGYRIFKTLNYKDIDKRFVAITKLMNYRGQLYTFSEEAVSVELVNQPAQIASTAGAIQLGTGAVLGQKTNVLTDAYGCQHQFSVIQTNLGMYAVDDRRHIIYRITDGIDILTDRLEVHSLIEDWYENSPYLPIVTKDNTINYNGIHSSANRYYNEVLFHYSVLDGEKNKFMTLVYDERLDAFITLYDMRPTMVMYHDKRTYSTNKTNRMYAHDIGSRGTWYDETYDALIEVVVNPPTNMQSIVLDNVKLYSQSDVVRLNPRIEAYPYKIRIRNTWQDDEYLLENIDNGETNNNSILYREQHHHISMRYWNENEEGNTRFRDRVQYITLYIDNKQNLRQNIVLIKTSVKESNI